MTNMKNRGRRVRDALRQARELGDAIERGRSASFSREAFGRYDQLRRGAYRR